MPPAYAHESVPVPADSAALAPGPPEPAPAAAPLWGGAVAAIVLLAAIPRVWDAVRTPLIFDEIYAVVFARLGLERLLATLAQDVDQPLNFILVWAWRHLGGEGEEWIRVPALSFGLATVVIAALLGRRMFGRNAALVAAAALALHPLHIQFSQQARFHAMVWCFLAFVLFSAWRWLEREPGRAGAGLVLAGAAALYTDWFSSFVLAAIALWGAWDLRRDRPRLLRWLGLFGLVVLLFAPQLPTLVAQIERDIEGERLLPDMPLGELGELLRKLAFNVRYLIPVFVALAALPLLRPGNRRAAAFLWSVCLFVSLVPFALSQAGIHLFINRQMMVTVPIFCLLVAAGAIGLRWRGLAVAAAAGVLVVAARTCLMREPLEETVSLPAAASFLRAETRPGDLILCTETRAHLFLRFYLPDRDSRLLIMPESEPFHYSDGILAIPAAWQIPAAEWRARAASDPRWWGLRLPHAGRDGPEAAAALGVAARGGSRSFGRTTVWIGSHVSRAGLAAEVPPGR